MTKYNYTFTEKKVSECAEFTDAGASELRVLMALIDLSGDCSEDELVERSATSKARVRAALALWEEAGIIRERGDEEQPTPYGNRIIYEFEERIIPGELAEQSAKQIAATVRSSKLGGLIDELALMMDKPMLTPMEVKNVTALASQYQLGEEYIATLAAHLKEKDSLSVFGLTARAKKLVENGVVTVDDLEGYIVKREAMNSAYAEFINLFGIYERALTPTERKYFEKWSGEYGYSKSVVGVAYDITVANTDKRSFKYMDKLLEDWHSHGCKTAEECEKRYEATSIERRADEAAKKAELAEKKSAAKKKPKPRYGDFDPEEAVRRAIARSYKSGDNGGENN